MGSVCNSHMAFVPEKDEDKTVAVMTKDGQVRVYSRRNSYNADKQNKDKQNKDKQNKEKKRNRQRRKTN